MIAFVGSPIPLLLCSQTRITRTQYKHAGFAGFAGFKPTRAPKLKLLSPERVFFLSGETRTRTGYIPCAGIAGFGLGLGLVIGAFAARNLRRYMTEFGMAADGGDDRRPRRREADEDE